MSVGTARIVPRQLASPEVQKNSLALGVRLMFTPCKEIKDSIRFVSHKNLVWRQDRRGARLVQISAPRQNLLNAASMEEMLIARTSRDLAPLGKGGMLFFSETWFGYTVEQPAWLARP